MGNACESAEGPQLWRAFAVDHCREHLTKRNIVHLIIVGIIERILVQILFILIPMLMFLPP